MITEDFVSRETAILLKEKGFHEPVRFEYHYYNTTPSFHRHLKDFNSQEYEGLHSEWYSAPTHQMAMAWLREKGIYITVYMLYNLTYGGDINIFGKSKLGKDDLIEVQSYHSYETYEEVIEVALEYTLKNLI